MRYKNLFLIGPSGAGKTTLAPVVARALGISVCDTDAEFEIFFGITGGGVIEKKGIGEFRNMEKVLLQHILSSQNEPLVFATGAGAWTIDAFREQAKQSGIVVCLHANPKILAERIKNSDRIITKLSEPDAVILQQINDRMALYASADYIFDSRCFSPEQLSKMISQIYTDRI